MIQPQRIYLDHSATTPVDPYVLEAMLPYFSLQFGNASSVHSFGQEARSAVDCARREVASLIGSRPNELVFTSGGTESNNLAVRGTCEALERYGRHIVTSQIEHPSIRGVVEYLEKRGWEVTRVPVSNDGLIDVSDIDSAIRPDTVLVTVMLANNEIGTIQPIAEIGCVIKDRRQAGAEHLCFHTDAVQAAGRIPIDVEDLGCDLLSMSAHKMYAAKGIGALYVKRGVRLFPTNIGGHQERERRAGTEAAPLIVGFGAAARLAREKFDFRFDYVKKLRDRFEKEVRGGVSDLVFNGNANSRLPHISNISFRYVEGEGLLIALDLQGIAVSTGSACSSGTLEPSPVIRALGRDEELARGAIRFSFGKDNSDKDVDYLLEVLPGVVKRLREASVLRVEARG